MFHTDCFPVHSLTRFYSSWHGIKDMRSIGSSQSKCVVPVSRDELGSVVFPYEKSFLVPFIWYISIVATPKSPDSLFHASTCGSYHEV